MGRKTSKQLAARLYKKCTENEPLSVDVAAHTMYQQSLLKYVSDTKFCAHQKNMCQQAIAEGWPIRVHGIFIDHLPAVLAQKKMHEVSRAERQPRTNKCYNIFRPVFVVVEKSGSKRNERELWVVTFPSPEYIDQVGEILAVFISHVSKEATSMRPSLKCVHYPECETELAEWSELRTGLVSHVMTGDIAAIGHVDTLAWSLKKFHFRLSRPVYTFGPSGLYELHALEQQTSKQRILLLGVKHSYWGSAAGRIALTLVESGVRHLFYVAKAGTLIGQAHIHRLVCPSGYYSLAVLQMEANG